MLALDALALMDALGIERAVVAGFDWGARTVDIIAASGQSAAPVWCRSAGTDRQPGVMDATIDLTISHSRFTFPRRTSSTSAAESVGGASGS